MKGRKPLSLATCLPILDCLSSPHHRYQEELPLPIRVRVHAGAVLQCVQLSAAAGAAEAAASSPKTRAYSSLYLFLKGFAYINTPHRALVSARMHGQTHGQTLTRSHAHTRTRAHAHTRTRSHGCIIYYTRVCVWLSLRQHRNPYRCRWGRTRNGRHASTCFAYLVCIA